MYYFPQGRYVSVWCLSVSLLVTSCKNYQSDLHENFTRDVSVDKELVKFWKSSTPGSGSRNSFEGFFNIVR